MDEDRVLVRKVFGGREIDPVEAASIHIALEELRDRADHYLEVEIGEDDDPARIADNCRAVATELGLRLRVTIAGTRHTLDAAGRSASEPAVLHVTVERDDDRDHDRDGHDG